MEISGIQDRDQIKSDFSDRLNTLLREKGLSQRDLSRLTGERPSKINEYCRGNSMPAADTAVTIAEALQVSVPFLILGKTEKPFFSLRKIAKPAPAVVPIVDVRLAAGAGSIERDNSQIGEMTFDDELMSQIGRSSVKGLVVMYAEGDSNEPLIKDGAPIVIDEEDNRLREGYIYAFRLGDHLRIKRLRYVGLEIEASSINPLYKPDIIRHDMMDQFTIIGRALATWTRL